MLLAHNADGYHDERNGDENNDKGLLEEKNGGRNRGKITENEAKDEREEGENQGESENEGDNNNESEGENEGESEGESEEGEEWVRSVDENLVIRPHAQRNNILESMNALSEATKKRFDEDQRTWGKVTRKIRELQEANAAAQALTKKRESQLLAHRHKLSHTEKALEESVANRQKASDEASTRIRELETTIHKLVQEKDDLDGRLNEVINENREFKKVSRLVAVENEKCKLQDEVNNLTRLLERKSTLANANGRHRQ